MTSITAFARLKCIYLNGFTDYREAEHLLGNSPGLSPISTSGALIPEF